MEIILNVDANGIIHLDEKCPLIVGELSKPEHVCHSLREIEELYRDYDATYGEEKKTSFKDLRCKECYKQH
jgi:hypothetical protein